MTRTLIVLLVLMLLVTPVAAQESTPYPTPTGIPLPEDQIFGGLQDADQMLDGADTDLTAPDGSPLLPEDNTALVIGYAKWLTSPSAAEEITGVFAPLFVTIGFWLQLVIVLLGLYIVVYVAIYLLRWVVWLIKLILQIVTAVSSVAGGLVGWLLGFIGL